MTTPPDPWSANDDATPPWAAGWEAPPPAPPGPVRPIVLLGRLVAGLMGLTLLVDLYAVNLGRDRTDLIGRLLARPNSVSFAVIDASDRASATTGVLQFAVFVVTAVLFLVWFLRAYRNVEARRRHLRHSAGWAIGAWFTPILNFFRPKQITDDVWRGSAVDPALDEPVPFYVHAWWAAFVVSGIFGQAALRTLNAGTLAEIHNATRITYYADMASVVLDALAIAVVWGLTKRQRRWTGEWVNVGAGTTPAEAS